MHEFVSSVSAILNLCSSYYDDQRALVSYYVSDKTARTNISLEEFAERIKRVTAEDVVRVSKKLRLDTVYFLAGKEES